MESTPFPKVEGAPEGGAFLSYASIPGDRILLHPTRPRWLRGNATLVEIAQALARSGGAEEPVAEVLAATYGLVPEAFHADVARVHAALDEKGMLESERIGEPTPRSIYLVLTEACNLACAHCCGGYPSCREAPLASVLALAEELIAAGGKLLTLSGGEPLLYPGLHPLLERIGRRIPVHICTNGILIESAWATWVAQHLDASFQISLDGPVSACHDAIRGEGAFEGALRGIQRLQAAGLGERIVVAATIQRSNIQELPELVRRAAELGVPRLRFIPVRAEGRAAEQWGETGDGLDVAKLETFFRQFLDVPGELPKQLDFNCGLSGFGLVLPDAEAGKDHWCPVGSQLTVEPDGSAYPCTSLMTEPFRLGNVFREGLSAMFASERMREVHAAKYLRKERIEACRPCAWRGFCQSGCMADAWVDTGSMWEADRMCGVRQRAYGRAFDLVLAAKSRG